jgi:hypothetical protein
VVSTRNVDGLGLYEVSFDRNVSNCAFLAGLGGTDNEILTGEVSATRSSGGVNNVFVLTSESRGMNVNQAFHLAVFC